MPVGRLEIFSVPGIPAIRAGDDLISVIAEAMHQNRLSLQSGDVVVIAQKIVSKSEGRLVDLETVRPSARALALAAETGKDARVVELILEESKRIVRSRENLIIAEHRLGFVMANAGIDQSNIGPQDGRDYALLLPRDPDASAAALQTGLSARYGGGIAVVISDSFGRAWRRGTVGIALGSAGLPALVDLRGAPDLFGRPLAVSMVGFADEVAAAASLLMGQAAEGQPVAIVRGLAWTAPANPARTLVRPTEEDLFR